MATDPYKYFRVEARELLEQLGRGALDLEQAAPPELIPRLLRLAHTLKGAARVVKQPEIADLCHGIEDTLAALREAGGPAPRGLADEILAKLDAIGGRVAALAPPPRNDEAVVDEAFRTIRADVDEMDALLEGLAEAHVELASLRRVRGPIERARHTADLLADQLSPPRMREPAGGGEGPAMIRARPMAQDLSDLVAATERGLGTGIDRIERELREVRETAERLRLLPASVLFTPLERAARDAARTLGKRVLFTGQGGDVRLDAQVLGPIQGALLQVVRNAVAHGIETESERRAAGKPPEGRITLEVVRRGGRVAFLCRDDGRGVDLEAVRRAAQRKGLLAGATAAPGREELLRLLLAGGLSTSGTVTEISGRGVGLDVVRQAAVALGGEVQARTREKVGMELELIVPVSVSSLQALVVEAAGVSAAIPLDGVRQALRVAPRDLAGGAREAALVFAGQRVPFVPLARALGRPLPSAPASRSWSAVVVGGGALAAVGVDRLIGAESIVLRPLPELAAASSVIAGAALDAAGNPRVVLDPRALVANAFQMAAGLPAAPAARPPILVVDDSLTTRMLEQSILESAGYEVDLAVSAEEALEKARRRRYGLFLVDVEMPGMDGFELLAVTRADPLLREVPAILVTSRNAPEDRRRGEEVGASGYVVKSEFNQVDLLHRIRRLVG
jgi:two-component system chemotaxis sensor kinase CheA